MKFDDLDKKMRVFETAADLCVLPGICMVARLDGRSFTRLTKEVCQFEAPFDMQFRDLMVATAESLMTCGFRVLYAYTESDEISLLFDPDEQLFGRKLRKYNSTLSGEASAQFSLKLGRPACFDCRISQLPTLELVVDYFRWRSEDAARNALNSWCYWTLRKDGQTEQQATRRLLGLSVSQKNELLFQYGINFNNMTMRKKIADWLVGTKNPGQEDAEPKQAIGGHADRISGHISRLFNDSPDVALFAADAIARLVAACSPEELLRLDEDVRWLYDWSCGQEWINLQPDDVQNLPFTERSRSAVLGIASFHANGHVREAAVRQLNDVDNGTELPFLLIRNNDWVADVQRYARTAIEQRVRDGRFDFSARNLYLLFRLLDKQRGEHSELVAMAVQQLVRPEHRSMLLEALDSSDRYIRRNVFRLSMTTPGTDLTELINFGVQSTDEVMRLWAIRKATAVFQEQDLNGLLANTQDDAFLPVRREVLHARAEHFPQQADECLRLALIDRSPSMRELARFYLRKRGVTDIAKVYRDILKIGEIDVAIAGIGETGGRADADLVVRYFRADASRVRKAAVRAVGQLASSEFIEPLVGRLSDDSAKVSQEAARWLGNHVFDIGATRLWELFQKDDRQHVKLTVLGLLDKFGTWHKLPYLIKAAANPDHRISMFATSRIERLNNRVFTHPSANEQQQIHRALDNCHDCLAPSFRDSVRHWVLARSQN